MYVCNNDRFVTMQQAQQLFVRNRHAQGILATGLTRLATATDEIFAQLDHTLVLNIHCTLTYCIDSTCMQQRCCNRYCENITGWRSRRPSSKCSV